MAVPSPWLLPAVPRPDATIRLVCVPHAGAGPSSYREFAGDLDGPDVAIAYLPGRQRRFAEPAIDQVGAVVAQLGPAVLDADPRPVALFGHSMGALVAYETARWLHRAGRPPVALIVSGCRAPHLPSRRISHDLPDEGFVAALRELGGTTPEVLGSPELLAELLPVLRSDFKLAETYRWTAEPILSCPIRAFHGRDDPGVSAGETAPWARHTTAGCTVTSVAGDHFFVLQHRREVTAAVTATLRATEPALE